MSDFKWEYLFNIEIALDSLPFILEGAWITILIAIVSMIISLILGLFIALARMSKFKFSSIPARLFISFMRGTPLLVILFILYFGLPMIGIELEPLTAAIVGMSVHFSAYTAEIIRSAISSVSKGQWEAAETLRMSYWQTMRRIILPQATRIALPPLSSVFMDIIKGTSLAMVITVSEMFYRAKVVVGQTYESLTLYILVALIYWGLCTVVTLLQDYLEKKANRYV
ncbi:amino acid ABC transporter permease [Cytobacillus sp. S13-E01]|uniref:amino acid ABC transporter permease n=1 Tax=Cytobacillus sp. S13-E01 TaxID=3031326 RepID=UPI0023D7E371|nr:amino acid ABC transporter permease [Cytobacillus sp. S13-E01]MDF0727037.1 amino acid ABC transporter permease [Cytobacillus sp. S13-E01]